MVTLRDTEGTISTVRDDVFVAVVDGVRFAASTVSAPSGWASALLIGLFE